MWGVLFSSDNSSDKQKMIKNNEENNAIDIVVTHQEIQRSKQSNKNCKHASPLCGEALQLWSLKTTNDNVAQLQSPISVSTVNVQNSREVHIGHKFINVTKGINIYGVVGITATLLIIASIVIYTTVKSYNTVPVDDAMLMVPTTGIPEDLITAPVNLTIVSRRGWQARHPEESLERLSLPAPLVIICHTATDFCHNQADCRIQVRRKQEFDIDFKGHSDIVYNFLVGGDGYAYYGRGWDYIGSHTDNYNNYSIGIALIGNFMETPPLQRQLDTCKKLIKEGVDTGKIAKDYKLIAHRQLIPTSSPGDKLFEILQDWPNYVKNTSLIENWPS